MRRAWSIWSVHITESPMVTGALYIDVPRKCISHMRQSRCRWETEFIYRIVLALDQPVCLAVNGVQVTFRFIGGKGRRRADLGRGAGGGSVLFVREMRSM